MMGAKFDRGTSVDTHERRFLTAADRKYVEELELALARVHHLPQRWTYDEVRAVVSDLNHRRARGDSARAEVVFPYGGAAAHAEVIAALRTTPRPTSPLSLAGLALLAAVAGLLGVRVALALVFRRVGPVSVGPLDVLLAVTVVGVILAGARYRGNRLRGIGGHWLPTSLALGFVLGLGGAMILRRLHIGGTLATLPFWLAAALAAGSAALTWLLTWPDDQRIAETTE